MLANAVVFSLYAFVAFCFVGSVLRQSKASRGLALVGVAVVLSVAYNPSIPGDSIREWTLLYVTGLLLLALLIKKMQKPRLPLITLNLLWYIAFIVVTYIFLPSNVGLLLKFAVVAVLTILVASRCGAEDRRFLIKGLVALATLHVILGSTEFATKMPALWGYDSLDSGELATYPNPFLGGVLLRIQSTMGHPIPLGVLIAAGILLLISNRAIFRPLFFVASGTILCAGLFLNGSRSAMLSCVAAIIFYLVFSKSSRSRFQNLIVVLLSGTALLVFDFGLDSLVGDFVDSGSFTNRLGAVESVPGLLSRTAELTTWGSGFGSESILFAQGLLQQNGFNIVDNQFVTILATFGVFGLTLISIILIISFRSGNTISRLGMVLMIGMMFSFDYFRWPETFILLYIFIGLSVQSVKARNRSTVLPGSRKAEEIESHEASLAEG